MVVSSQCIARSACDVIHCTCTAGDRHQPTVARLCRGQYLAKQLSARLSDRVTVSDEIVCHVDQVQGLQARRGLAARYPACFCFFCLVDSQHTCMNNMFLMTVLEYQARQEKERKGKERKGKERKGKEGKGKEREGNETRLRLSASF